MHVLTGCVGAFVGATSRARRAGVRSGSMSESRLPMPADSDMGGSEYPHDFVGDGGRRSHAPGSYSS